MIVGAGPTGLAAAIAIKQKDSSADVLILEKRHKLNEVEGAGIAMPANSVVALRELGLTEELKEHAYQVKHCIYTEADGRPICRASFTATGTNVPFMAINRGELQNLLLKKARTLGVKVQTGCELINFKQNNNATIEVNWQQQVPISADNKKSELLHDTFDLLISADGIHSKTRALVFPDVKVQDFGLTNWRCIADKPTEFKELEFEPTFMWGNQGQLVMLYPFSKDQCYMYFHTFDEEKNDAQYRSFSADDFKSFGLFVPEILNQIKTQNISLTTSRFQITAKPCYFNPKFSSVLLIGDAAHPVTPILQQGATQGFWDAYFLGKLYNEATVETLPMSFSRSRQDIMQNIMNRSNDPVKNIVSSIRKGDFAERITALRKAGTPLNIAGWKNLFASYPDQINVRITAP